MICQFLQINPTLDQRMMDNHQHQQHQQNSKPFRPKTILWTLVALAYLCGTLGPWKAMFLMEDLHPSDNKPSSSSSFLMLYANNGTMRTNRRNLQVQLSNNNNLSLPQQEAHRPHVAFHEDDSIMEVPILGDKNSTTTTTAANQSSPWKDLEEALMDLWNQVVLQQQEKNNATRPQEKKNATTTQKNKMRKRRRFPEQWGAASHVYSWIASVSQTNVYSSHMMMATATSNVSHSNPPPPLFLATHGSVDRWPMIQRQIQHWNGPVSLALYLTQGPSEIQALISQLQTFLYKYAHAFTLHVHMEAQRTKYPHNALRDLALHGIPLDQNYYWCALDADFCPVMNTHDILMNQVLHPIKHAHLVQKVQDQRNLLVLPAFALDDSDNVELPTNRSQALALIQAGIMLPFNNGTIQRGHQSTNFEKWQNQNFRDDEHLSPSYPIGFGKQGFEPYVVGYLDKTANNKNNDKNNKGIIPHYWKGFRGWGCNKVSFNHALVLAGYQYRVLWDVWVVHVGIPPSEYKRQELQANTLEWRYYYKPYLNETYRPGKGLQRYL